MSTNHTVSREFAQRGGWKVIYVRIWWVLPVCQDDLWAICAEGSEEEGEIAEGINVSEC